MIYTKAHIVKDKAARDEWAVSGDHGNRCQLCWRPFHRATWRGFSTHHIVGGANGRSDEPCNLLMVCADCHDMMYNSGNSGAVRLTMGMVLRIKRATPSWDGERLRQLFHRTLPDMERLPQVILDIRNTWLH